MSVVIDRTRWTSFWKIGLAHLFVMLGACESQLAGNQRQTAPTIQVKVVQSFPHDSNAFVQGLIVEGETFYESTGQYGNSSIRKVDMKSGRVLMGQPLNADYFAEGIAELNGYIYQLTWKNRTCVVYEKATLQAKGVYRYQGEGWGLTTDGKMLFMSDGSSTIRVLDAGFQLKRTIRVKDGRRAVIYLNELEFIEGFLYANVWHEDRIAKIDPKTGSVVAWIDCSGVYPANARPSREHVLNGIAYDPKTERTFITGKNWPRIYEIQILDGEKQPGEGVQREEDAQTDVGGGRNEGSMRSTDAIPAKSAANNGQ